MAPSEAMKLVLLSSNVERIGKDVFDELALHEKKSFENYAIDSWYKEFGKEAYEALSHEEKIAKAREWRQNIEAVLEAKKNAGCLGAAVFLLAVTGGLLSTML